MSILDYIISKNVLNLDYSKKLDSWLKENDKINYYKGDIKKLFHPGKSHAFDDFFRTLEKEYDDDEYTPEGVAQMIAIEYNGEKTIGKLLKNISCSLKPTKDDIREFTKNARDYLVNFNIQIHGKIYPTGDDLTLDLLESIEELKFKFEEFLRSYGDIKLFSITYAGENTMDDVKVKVKYSKVHKKYYGVIDYNELNSRSIRFEITITQNEIHFEDFFFEHIVDGDITLVANIHSLDDHKGDIEVINISLC